MIKLPIIKRSKGHSSSRLTKPYKKATTLIRIPTPPIPVRMSAMIGINPTSWSDFGILYTEYARVSTGYVVSVRLP